MSTKQINKARVSFVFQQNNWNPMATTTDPKDFTCVASLTTFETDEHALRHASENTNSRSEHWSETMKNKNIWGAAFKTDARSTSIGDLVLVNQTLYRCESFGWAIVENANIESFIAHIPNPAMLLQARVDYINTKENLGLSFGYIGNLEPHYDDRCWSIWANATMPSGRKARFGQFDTKDLGRMVELTNARLNEWVALLKASKFAEAQRLG